MTQQPELMAPCGLWCGACGVYQASQRGDEALKAKMAKAYFCQPEEVECGGCLSDQLFGYCQICAIRSCAQDKGLEGCHACDEYPCGHIEDFPVISGKEVIVAETPRRRELGEAAWEEDQRKAFSCPHCSAAIFRGAKKCRGCGELLI